MGIESLWSPDDVVFANLESVIDFDGGLGGKDFHELVNRGTPLAAAVMASAGVDVVSLSNNHILEHGPEVLRSTQKSLSEHSINYVGAGKNRTFATWSNLKWVPRSVYTYFSTAQRDRCNLKANAWPDESIELGAKARVVATPSA